MDSFDAHPTYVQRLRGHRWNLILQSFGRTMVHAADCICSFREARLKKKSASKRLLTRWCKPHGLFILRRQIRYESQEYSELAFEPGHCDACSSVLGLHFRRKSCHGA